MYKTGCVIKVTVPGQGMFAGHIASGSNWSPYLEMYDLDTETSHHSSLLLRSGLQAQSGWL